MFDVAAADADIDAALPPLMRHGMPRAMTFTPARCTLTLMPAYALFLPLMRAAMLTPLLRHCRLRLRPMLTPLFFAAERRYALFA